MKKLSVVYSCTQESRNLHPLLDWVWTHVASVLGTLLPYSGLFSDGLNNAIQIGYWEELSKLRLTDLLEMTPDISPFPKPSADALAAELTRGKLDHPHKAASFKALFLTEVEGALDAHREEITGALQHIIGREEMQEARVDAEVAMMIEQFRTGAVGTQMPFINTQAGLHALFRWNRDQQFKANDWLDYMHAASALPYFDFFFTERVLARVVSSPPLAYDSLYGTHVRSDARDALELLESI